MNHSRYGAEHLEGLHRLLEGLAALLRGAADRRHDQGPAPLQVLVYVLL